MTAELLLTLVTAIARVLAIAAVVLLASSLAGATAGMFLRERRHGYRLPYEALEQSSHVRVLRGDET